MGAGSFLFTRGQFVKSRKGGMPEKAGSEAENLIKAHSAPTEPLAPPGTPAPDQSRT